MRLFVYYDVQGNMGEIHAIPNNSVGYSGPTYICGRYFSRILDIKNYLDTSRPFCRLCTSMLEEKGIDIIQLAINQKLGVR